MLFETQADGADGIIDRKFNEALFPTGGKGGDLGESPEANCGD